MKTKSILVLALAFLSFSAIQAQDKKVEKKAVSKPEAKPAVAPAVSVTPQTAKPAENPNSADFKFEKEEHNFGNINQGDVVNYEFKFTNVGKEPLIITNAAGSCGCTVPDYPKEPIKPGADGVIKVTFNSSGKSGMQDKTVTISSNAKEASKVIHIKGNVNVPAAPAATPEKANPVKMEAAPVKK